MKLLKTAFPAALACLCALQAQAQQQPVYLDDTKPIEERVEDALARMTLEEKIAVIHAQSKFSSPGVKRLGIPEFWTSDGPHGVRPDVLWDDWKQAGTPTTRAWLSLRSPVWPPLGTPHSHGSTARALAKRPSTAGKT